MGERHQDLAGREEAARAVSPDPVGGCRHAVAPLQLPPLGLWMA
jgi:hypothetical protein